MSATHSLCVWWRQWLLSVVRRRCWEGTSYAGRHVEWRDFIITTAYFRVVVLQVHKLSKDRTLTVRYYFLSGSGDDVTRQRAEAGAPDRGRTGRVGHWSLPCADLPCVSVCRMCRRVTG